MKKCSKCGETKEFTQFGKDNRAKSGLTSLCKACNRERWKKYRQEHPERVKQSNKKWAENNREHRRQYNKQHSQTPEARYKVHCSGAKKRGLLNDIDLDRYKTITSQPCAYCGTTESLRGLDRVYNDFPYTIDNVVSCCKDCNYAKHKMDFNEFFALLDRIQNKRNQGFTQQS